MKMLTAAATALVLTGVLAAPTQAQRTGFASKVQEANAANPGFLKALEGPLKQVAERVLTDIEVDAVSIDARTGEMVVRGTRNGTPVTLAGADIGGGEASPQIFGWLSCAWNWFTSLGSEGCDDAATQAPPPVETPWDRAQEAKHRAAFLEMTGHE